MYVNNKQSLIKNGLTERDREARRIALEIVETVLSEASPERAVEKSLTRKDEILHVDGLSFDLRLFENIYVLGGGKACAGMAQSVENILKGRIRRGIVNIPYGVESRYALSDIELNEASHPLPDEKGVAGAKKMMEIARNATEKDLIILLISGGGSAFLTLPATGLYLEDIKEITAALLKSGATIDEVNAVRKHVSAIKGGRFAKECYPATVLSLIISDVVGDRIDTIASGPSAPDKTTYGESMDVLSKYKLLDKYPRVSSHIQKGMDGLIRDTPKSGSGIFDRVYNRLICTNRSVLEKVIEDLADDYDLNLYTTNQTGEAREIGVSLAQMLMKKAQKKKEKPSVILCGGETTVTVRGGGKGGRNQELVLAAIAQLAGDGFTIASFGTDGIDGMTDAAGAIADGQSHKRALEQGLHPATYLKNNDSYNFFIKLADLIFTGPSGTNITDVTVMVTL